MSKSQGGKEDGGKRNNKGLCAMANGTEGEIRKEGPSVFLTEELANKEKEGEKENQKGKGPRGKAALPCRRRAENQKGTLYVVNRG